MVATNKFDKGDTVYVIDQHLKSLIYNIVVQTQSFDRYTNYGMAKIATNMIAFGLKDASWCYDEDYLMTTRMVLTEKTCEKF